MQEINEHVNYNKFLNRQNEEIVEHYKEDAHLIKELERQLIQSHKTVNKLQEEKL